MAYKHNTVEYGFGQIGSAYTTNGSSALVPPAGKVFVAITMLADTKFNADQGLIAQNDTENGIEYIGTDLPAHDVTNDANPGGNGGLVVDGVTFPKGVTIYGRWTQISIDTGGGVVAYIGD